jgi:cation:H+ antiporter
MELGLGAWAVVFLGAAVLVGGGGVLLARGGDALAEVTGMGRMTVGLLLLGLVTSLPEIATSMVAAATGAPDLAVGAFLGSNMANMAILAGVDLLSRRRVFPLVTLSQARIATGAIVLTALVGLAIVSSGALSVGPLGVDSLTITVAFVAVLVWIRRAPARLRADAGPADEAPPASGRRARGTRGLRQALAVLAVGALLTLGGAPALAVAAEEIATATGLAQTFVGVVFLAAATSFPELVTSVAALRIGAIDLAVGNLFGSNAFNMGAIVLADLAYTPGAILAAGSSALAVVAFGAVLLTGLGLAAVLHGDETRVWRVEPDAILILVGYLLLLGVTAGVPT